MYSAFKNGTRHGASAPASAPSSARIARVSCAVGSGTRECWNRLRSGGSMAPIRCVVHRNTALLLKRSSSTRNG